MNAELRQDIEALTDTVRRFTLEKIAPHVAPVSYTHLTLPTNREV